MNKRKSQSIRLIVMIVLTFSFFVVELVVGYVTGSLALVSDSYHMLSDFIALFIGLACVRISYWNSKKNTYGWVRAEVLGALVNSVFLIALCFTILTDGITRLVEPQKIEKVDLLLYVGIAGLCINIFGLIMFCSDTQGGHHGHSHGGGGHGHHRKNSHHSHDSGHQGHSHADASHVGQGQMNYGSELLGSELENSVHAGAHLSNSTSAVIEMRPEENHHHHNHSHHDHVESAGDRTAEVLPEYFSTEISALPPPYSAESLPPDNDEDSSEGSVSYIKEAVLIKSGSQMNMIGVYLHVLGDALGSVVVIVSALVIKFVKEEWVYRLDPAMSIVMSIIILSTTIPLFKASAMILLQTVPRHINVSALQDKLLRKVKEITGIHELHVWQLAGDRIVASGHIRVTVDSLNDYASVALKVKSFFHDEGIHSTTFQPEFNESMGQLQNAARDCFLECGPDKQCFESTCCSNKFKKKNSDASQDNPSTGSAEETGHSTQRTVDATNGDAQTAIEIENNTTAM